MVFMYFSINLMEKFKVLQQNRITSLKSCVFLSGNFTDLYGFKSLHANVQVAQHLVFSVCKIRLSLCTHRYNMMSIHIEDLFGIIILLLLKSY